MDKYLEYKGQELNSLWDAQYVDHEGLQRPPYLSREKKGIQVDGTSSPMHIVAPKSQKQKKLRKLISIRFLQIE